MQTATIIRNNVYRVEVFAWSCCCYIAAFCHDYKRPDTVPLDGVTVAIITATDTDNIFSRTR